MRVGQNWQVKNNLMVNVPLLVFVPMLSRMTGLAIEEKKIGNEVISVDQERKVRFF